MKSPLTQPEAASISLSPSSLSSAHNIYEALQAPMQVNACFQILFISMWLSVSCGLVIAMKAKCHMFHDFSLIVADQQFSTILLDTFYS